MCSKAAEKGKNENLNPSKNEYIIKIKNGSTKSYHFLQNEIACKIL